MIRKFLLIGLVSVLTGGLWGTSAQEPEMHHESKKEYWLALSKTDNNQYYAKSLLRAEPITDKDIEVKSEQRQQIKWPSSHYDPYYPPFYLTVCKLKESDTDAYAKIEDNDYLLMPHIREGGEWSNGIYTYLYYNIHQLVLYLTLEELSTLSNSFRSDMSPSVPFSVLEKSETPALIDLKNRIEENQQIKAALAQYRLSYPNASDEQKAADRIVSLIYLELPLVHWLAYKEGIIIAEHIQNYLATFQLMPEVKYNEFEVPEADPKLTVPCILQLKIRSGQR